MIEVILAKVHPKVKWGQIFNNVWSAWMTYQIVCLAMYISKMYTLIMFCHAFRNYNVLKTDSCCYLKSKKYLCASYWFFITENQLIPIFTPNVSYSKLTLFQKIWVQCMTKYDLKVSKTLNPFFSKLILCYIGTSLTERFIWTSFMKNTFDFSYFLKFVKQ